MSFQAKPGDLRTRNTHVSGQEKTDVFAQGERNSSFFYLFVLCGPLHKLDDALLHWGGLFSLLSLLVQMLFSFGNALTDTSRNNVFPAICASFSSVKLTQLTITGGEQVVKRLLAVLVTPWWQAYLMEIFPAGFVFVFWPWKLHRWVMHGGETVLRLMKSSGLPTDLEEAIPALLWGLQSSQKRTDDGWEWGSLPAWPAGWTITHSPWWTASSARARLWGGLWMSCRKNYFF